MNALEKIFLNLISFILFFLLISPLTAEKKISTEDIRELQELRLGESVVNKEEKFLELQTSVQREEEDCIDCIYGYNFFVDTPTTFALSTNTPVPQDYVLGPGDKIDIQYFGNNKSKSSVFISRNGSINLPLLGPITIAGLDLKSAQELIKKRVDQGLIGTEVYISLSELRSINVYIVGAAYKPGTYTVSSLASLTNIIFATGGPSKVGSLRNIQIKRNGKVVKTYDFYKFLLEGDTSQDMRLLEGDTVFYPLIKNTMRIGGSVQRPGNYELLEESPMSEILQFSGLQKNSDIKIEFSRYDKRSSSRKVTLFSKIEESSKISLQDGDSVNVIRSSKQDQANVLLSGEFLYPGYYDISGGQTISEIILQAGGFSEFAYPEAAVFTRESVRNQQKESYEKNAQNLERSLIDAVSSGNPIDGEAYMAISQFIQKLREQEPIGRQVASIDEYSLQSDPKLDFSLQDGDTIFVPKRSSSISVVGEVLNSTNLLFTDTLTVQDYINLAGGTTEGADLSRIFIILPNGQALLYKKKLFQSDISLSLMPGSTIVVSRDPDPYNWLKLTSVITPILSDLAISAASISAISNNN